MESCKIDDKNCFQPGRWTYESRGKARPDLLARPLPGTHSGSSALSAAGSEKSLEAQLDKKNYQKS